MVFIALCIAILIWYLNAKDKRVNRIKQRLQRGDTILDVGCGTCCLGQALGSAFNVTGLDVVNKAKCMVPVLYDGHVIPFPDNSFDVVIASFVLHHVPQQLSLLCELKRVCRRSLIIVEDTPENEHDWTFVKQHAKSSWGSCDACFHTKKTWENIFHMHELKVHTSLGVSRWEIPFSDQPLIYPVPVTFFELLV